MSLSMPTGTKVTKKFVIFPQHPALFNQFFIIFAFIISFYIYNKELIIMKYIYVCTMLMLAFAASPATAQKKKKKAKPQPEVQLSEEELMRNARIEQMTGATQKIVFIDSMVVDKKDLPGCYAVSRDAGKLCRYGDFFKDSGNRYSHLHINGLGNKCYFSGKDTAGSMRLYTADRIGKQWTKPAALEGPDIESGYEEIDYPFIMADGTTLYFAAKGDESIGGYDIFETVFNSETGTFLKPENIGMPFNSTANDYMYAIDETEGIGWFATDRNQPEGKVCIYTFVQPESRQVYSEEECGKEQMARLARIESIADTWGNGNAKNEALARLTRLRSGKSEQKNVEHGISFVINDNVTYSRPEDFRAAGNTDKFRQLQEMRTLAKTIADRTEAAREQYAAGNTAEKDRLKAMIMKNEKDGEALEMQIRQMEKDIRNAENRLLNHNK